MFFPGRNATRSSVSRIGTAGYAARVLAPDDPMSVAFFGLAALFIAASVAYVANALPEQVVANRPMYFAFGYISHPAARAVVVVVEIGVVVMFTQLTFGAATDPTEPSRANALIYLAAFGAELLAILLAVARPLRAVTTR